MTNGARILIVNADDFGLTPGINRGIIEGHQRGIVTSTSFMVRYPAAAEAAKLAEANPGLGVGLHVDLGEWELRGEWVCKYAVVPESDGAAVFSEVISQLRRFQELVGRLPTHLDSHQHVHRNEPLRSILRNLAAELRIPLRGEHEAITYRGDFYGQNGDGSSNLEAVGLPAILRMLEELPAGATEIGCHPGYVEGLDSVYRQERVMELETLCKPELRAAVKKLGISLRSFDHARVDA